MAGGTAFTRATKQLDRPTANGSTIDSEGAGSMKFTRHGIFYPPPQLPSQTKTLKIERFPGMTLFFDQTFEVQDIALVVLLVVLEGVLSIDNALVLGLLAKRLPKSQRAKALMFGLVGAFVFRLLAILMATLLLRSAIAKLLGGLYLLYVAGKYFWEVVFPPPEEHDPDAAANGDLPVSDPLEATVTKAANTGKKKSRRWLWFVSDFWATVIVIELTDIAFAVDSIVAAMGVVGSPPDNDEWHPKLWVVLFGGFVGLVLMRYAATMFIRLLERFPRFETAAYLLVAVIGLKLVLDWAFHLNFHSTKSPAFWIFWLCMVGSFLVGFLPKKTDPEKPPPPTPPA